MSGNHKAAEASRRKKPADKVYPVPTFTVKVGKGVMAKDGITPYAPGTIMAGAERKLTQLPGQRIPLSGVMMSPYTYSVECLLGLIISGDFTHITVITEDNNQFDIVKEPKIAD